MWVLEVSSVALTLRQRTFTHLPQYHTQRYRSKTAWTCQFFNTKNSEGKMMEQREENEMIDLTDITEMESELEAWLEETQKELDAWLEETQKGMEIPECWED